MNALASLARTWPMLSALGAGLVLLALAAGAGGMAGVVLAGAGIAGLGWGVLSLRAGRAVVPRAALGVSAALLVGSGALVGTGLAESADVAVGPLLAASAFTAVVGGHAAFLVRRSARAARPAPDAVRPTVHARPTVAAARPAPHAARHTVAAARPAVEGRLSLVGLVVGALLVSALATPALAATEAGELAVPHGWHGGSGGHGTTGGHGGH
ncbi:hypothetical protein ACFWN7_12080 [Agromyces sp. NPDC058484]|uniref:hypothetical protein n=1 Tax=Agromyces sp. NPDC058484 TaxID=3346524 RepID=UPI003651A7C8